MRVEKLYIKNFRSIEELDIELQPLCAFIGPNNAGKSNILDALNHILGERWPTTPGAFSDRDFRDHDTTLPIEIKAIFDGLLNDDYNNPRIHGFVLKVNDPDDVEFYPIDDQEERLYYSGGRPLRISNDMREQIPLLNIGIDRRAESQLRPTRWTFWGKINEELNRRFGEDKDKVADFIKKTGEAVHLLQIPELQRAEQILLESIREQTALSDLSLKFGLTDPVEYYKNLRPYLKNIKGGPEFDPEEMGMGTQSALVVALVDVYRQIVRESAILLIQEPELYLHPHACRHFYSLLKELSKSGVQVIFTTHSPAFLDIADYQSIYLVHKEEEVTKVFEGSEAGISEEDRTKMITRFDSMASEVFFAKAVLLVEGPEDRIACSRAFQLHALDVDKEGVSITCCGGKPGIPLMAKILTSLKIPTCVFCDRDPGKPTEKESEEIEKIVGDEYFFELPKKLEDALGLDRKLDQVELMEFLDKYDSLDEMPESFRNIIKQVIGRIETILGFDF